MCACGVLLSDVLQLELGRQSWGVPGLFVTEVLFLAHSFCDTSRSEHREVSPCVHEGSTFI